MKIGYLEIIFLKKMKVKRESNHTLLNPDKENRGRFKLKQNTLERLDEKREKLRRRNKIISYLYVEMRK